MTGASSTEDSPAGLFLDYYAEASSWSGSQRATAPQPDLSFGDLAASFMREDDGALVRAKLESLVDGGKLFSPEVRRGRILAAMKAIDLACYEIHPRNLVTAATPSVPLWLREKRLARTLSGEYARTEESRLIARGPLTRNARHEHASSGDQLSDYFAALAVAPLTIQHDGRDIEISMQIFEHDPFTGIPISATSGSESVGFIPLAIAPTDIEARSVVRFGRTFAAYGPAGSFDASAEALAGLRALGSVDIAIMPELAMTEKNADELSTALVTEPNPVARMIVCASYSTLAVSLDEQPWNECRIYNNQGAELWRQRKLWTAGVSQANAIRYGLSDPGPGTLTLEDNAAGSELVVSDVEGLGRCVVLICQDCEMPILGPSLLATYQPDWVFTPIFDCSIDPGRWAHARAFSLSPLSQARFLAVTNMAFADVGANMGLAVGPKEAADRPLGELDRAFLLVTKPMKSEPQVGSLKWRNGLWHQSWLDVRPA